MEYYFLNNIHLFSYLFLLYQYSSIYHSNNFLLYTRSVEYHHIQLKYYNQEDKNQRSKDVYFFRINQKKFFDIQN